MASLQVHVDAVRTAVASSATCTPATVVSLKSLLLPRDAESQPQPAPTIAKTARGTAASTSRPATAASSRPGTAAAKRRPATATAAARADARQQPDAQPSLSDKEKAQLATHVINAALKALAEAAKPTTAEATAVPPKTPARVQSTTASDEAAAAPPKSTARGGLRRSMSAPMTPLQPRTLNRVSTSPIKTASKPAASAPAAPNAQCLATVECARVAFTTLRTLQDGKAVALPELQLEAGMSSFVAKLLGLNMLDQACRELRVLKKRLQGPVSSIPTETAPPAPAAASSVKTTKTAKTTTKAAAKNFAQTTATDAASSSTTCLAADILEYGDLSATSMPAIKLIIASQLQALRILAALKKPAHIDAALPFLRRSCKSSPIQLISMCIKAASVNAAEKQKLLRQLETLSQLLLALAPSISSKDDSSATEPKLSVAPLAALELQALSLETRLRCWIMAGSQASNDADKDILMPFSRCLSTYARRSRSSNKALSYSSCRGRFDQLMELVKSGNFLATKTSKSPTASIYQTLSAVARETGHIDEAIHWASELFSFMNPDVDSAAKCCSISAQLLSLQLKNPAKKYTHDCKTLLTDMLESIKGSLKGDTAELEDLLANVCLVRKAAVNLIISQTQQNINANTKTNSNTPHPFKLLLESLVYQCPRFCLRWLGKPPAAKSSTKDFLRYEQRRQLLTQSIRHTLDSAFVVTKALIEEDRMVWEQLDSVLSDSLTVLEYLGDLKTADSSSSYYVKISHFYYLSYNVLRRKGDDQADRDALKALRRAIDCIKHRPGPEREKAQLILKLERMADLAKSTGQIGEALGALQSIRSNLVDDGALATVTAALKKLSPSLAWTATDQTESLSRTLVSIHRLEQVHMDWSGSFEELEQAAVLEHQLHFIHFGNGNSSSGPSKSARLTENLDLSHPCVESLLRIYYPTQFPVRRLRTLLRLFSANIDKPDVLADIMPQTKAVLGLIDSQGLADDASLAGYLPHYRSMATSLAGFTDGYTDVDAFQSCLSAWKSILEANPTLSELELAIDNVPEFQTHLHSMSEFMRAMGRDTAITRILELSQSLSSILSASDNSRSFSLQPAYQSALSLSAHYLRMGDCVKAEKMLENIRDQLDSSTAVSTAANISFHLSYAEYLIAARRFDEASHHLLEAKPASSEEPTQAQGLVRLSGSQKRRLGAHACFLQSLIALEKGDHSVALQNARNGVRMLFQDWSRMEKAMERPLLSADSSLDGEDDRSTEISSSSSSSSSSGQSSDAHASPETSPASTPDTSAILAAAGPTAVASPEFWALFHPLFNSMLRLSSIYAYLGMFQETMYYAEQAHKVATVTNAALSLAQAESWLATVCLKAGQNEKTVTFLAQARSRLPEMDETHRKASLACELASLYRERGDEQSEQELIRQAEQIVQHICSSESVGSASDDSAKKEPVEEKKGRATVGRRTKAAAATPAKMTTTMTRTTATRRTAAATKTPAKTTKKIVATAVETAEIIETMTPPTANATLTENAAAAGLRAALFMQKTMSHLSKKDWATALSILQSNGTNDTASKSQADILAGHIALAACLLGHSTEQMARDAVFSVIQDSTLSFPAVSGGIVTISGDGAERLSVSKSPVAVKVRGMASALGKSAKNAASFVEMLQEAQDCLIEAQSIAAVAGDSVTLNRISSMLQSAVIVLSATSWTKPCALGHPSYASCSVELARNMTWKRERRAVLVEKAMLTKQDVGGGDASWWPAVAPSTAPAVATITPTGTLNGTARRTSMTGGASGSMSSVSKMADINIGRFQRDYIDIIPKDWSVVSMALSENKHDLCITKLQAGQSPFVIRLPLERAISRDADNEVFNYQQGRAELLEIVQAINDSCHDARDMTVRGAKSSWWTEREALDMRLKELLDNVEQIWLGGFRGIFSQHVRRPTLFARFQKTFQGILDKHLPSRRSAAARGTKKRGGKAPASASPSMRVALDSRVLDLFIGLGDATEEGCDFDDVLDDLLYFVVDILQFHGERNAYDEIDFDSMVVETFDALFAYHSAVNDSQGRSSATAAGEPSDHLHSILVLDKSLHVFPWEALPCMTHLAVSRVPSLACLRRLILEQQQQQHTPMDADELREPSEAVDRPSGYRASLASGAYMLNPSGDLPSTETTFDGPLTSSLRGPQWTRIVGRTPTEDEFESILRDKDVLLYFGHGSGAQYIRGRTVRKLERCRATALLMGCSSAGLNYNGEFELHGPVWDYMMAGCPAVVGTLWDVTDKDIDRFAGQAFEEWGLVSRGAFDDSSKDSKNNKSSKSSKKTSSTSPTRATASLVEAIMRARDAPRFRYLTAAAVCVYGIPVYLQ
ncbi:separin protein [Sporothrix bragantina]|uniref:separase n=1 Tax=Sporothrix bragantina TaxID=671064 RepID=A0ABP0BLA7_9PEZI